MWACARFVFAGSSGNLLLLLQLRELIMRSTTRSPGPVPFPPRSFLGQSVWHPRQGHSDLFFAGSRKINQTYICLGSFSLAIVLLHAWLSSSISRICSYVYLPQVNKLIKCAPPPCSACSIAKKKIRVYTPLRKKNLSFFFFLDTVGLLLFHEALVPLVLCGLAILFFHPPSIIEDTACAHATEYKLV